MRWQQTKAVFIVPINGKRRFTHPSDAIQSAGMTSLKTEETAEQETEDRREVPAPLKHAASSIFEMVEQGTADHQGQSP